MLLLPWIYPNMLIPCAAEAVCKMKVHSSITPWCRRMQRSCHPNQYGICGVCGQDVSAGQADEEGGRFVLLSNPSLCWIPAEIVPEILLVKSPEGVLTHQNHISQVFFRYHYSPEAHSHVFFRYHHSPESHQSSLFRYLPSPESHQSSCC